MLTKLLDLKIILEINVTIDINKILSRINFIKKESYLNINM